MIQTLFLAGKTKDASQASVLEEFLSGICLAFLTIVETENTIKRLTFLLFTQSSSRPQNMFFFQMKGLSQKLCGMKL